MITDISSLFRSLAVSRVREEKPRMQRAIVLEFTRAADGDKDLPDNCFRMTASTDADYDWGYYNEKLTHTKDAVDTSSAFSVLLNHDPDQIIGRIMSCEPDGRQLNAVVEIDPNATTENGIKLVDAIKKKYVRGVSIGYDYRREDCTFSEDENGRRSIVANKWQLREISITPTPADLAAQVRQRSESWAMEAFAKAKKGKEISMDFANWLKARGLKQEDLSPEGLTNQRSIFDAEQKAERLKNDAAKVEDGNELAKERAARIAAENKAGDAVLVLEMLEMARSHEVKAEAKDFSGLTRAACIELMLKRKATAEKSEPAGGVAVDITADASEKQRDAAVNALLHRGGMPVEEKLLQGNPYAGRRNIEVGRRFARLTGVRGVDDWSEREVAGFMVGNRGRGQRSANVSADMFSTYVLALTMDKAVALGFKAFGEEGQATYKLWTRVREVSDFKAVTGAALDVGNLQKTVEDAPFPELTKAEFGYTAALNMWGVTASLTLQTLINDDLGEFLNQIFRSGQVANRTIEKETYAQLEALTWTGNTSSGAGLGTGVAATPANLDVCRQAFLNKVGPTGEKLGNVPRFLIYQPSQGVPVGIALGRIINYNGVSGSAPVQSITPVETPYLAGTATTYYLVGSPNLTDTVVILMLNGLNTPQIEEFDAGAVAARKWKIYLPFTAKPVLTTVNQDAGGTLALAPGMQQGTV